MGISTFSVFSSIFGFIVAAITLFAFFTNICRSYLPSNRIKELEDQMDQTETFFEKSVEDGLLVEPGFIGRTRSRLTKLRRKTYRLQSRVYNVTTLRQDYLEFRKGTSTSIGHTCRSLKELKAQVFTSSEKARCSRLLERTSVHRSTPIPALPLSTDTEHNLNPLLPPRSHSCPPALSEHDRLQGLSHKP